MQIINFRASNFRGDCFIDREFEPYLLKMNEVLIRHGMIWITTSSGRLDTNVKGAIVDPAKKGNHLVYHGIDGNLIGPDGKYYNSKKMGDGTGPDEACCHEIVKESGLYWGQAFNHPDSVHFDDRLNLKDPKLWQKKYNELHNSTSL